MSVGDVDESRDGFAAPEEDERSLLVGGLAGLDDLVAVLSKVFRGILQRVGDPPGALHVVHDASISGSRSVHVWRHPPLRGQDIESGPPAPDTGVELVGQRQASEACAARKDR